MNKNKQFVLILIACAGIFCAPNRACAQDSAALPDSPSQTAQFSRESSDAPEQREVSWSTLPKDFLHDQKGIWLFPVQLAKGRHWLPTLAVTGVTAGLIVADPHVMPFFRDHAKGLDDLSDTFDPSITTAEVVALPVSLMIAGYVRHDSYQTGTAILAGE